MSTATPELLDGHSCRETQRAIAVEGTTSADHSGSDAQQSRVDGTHFPSGQNLTATQSNRAAGDLSLIHI